MHGKKTQKIGVTRTNSRLNSIKEHPLSPKDNKRILQNLKKSLMTQEDIPKDQKTDFIGRKKSPNKKIIYSKMNRSQFDSLLTKNLSTSQINTTQFNSHLNTPKTSFNAYNSSALNSPNRPQPTPNMNLKNLLSKKIQNQFPYNNTQPKILLEPKKELRNINSLSNIKKILDIENFNSIIIDQRNNQANEQKHIDLGVEYAEGDWYDSDSCSNGEFSITEMSEIEHGHFGQRGRVKGGARSEVSLGRVVRGRVLSLRGYGTGLGGFFEGFDQMLTGLDGVAVRDVDGEGVCESDLAKLREFKGLGDDGSGLGEHDLRCQCQLGACRSDLETDRVLEQKQQEREEARLGLKAGSLGKLILDSNFIFNSLNLKVSNLNSIHGPKIIPKSTGLVFCHGGNLDLF
jgi:hypothetical protein